MKCDDLDFRVSSVSFFFFRSPFLFFSHRRCAKKPPTERDHTQQRSNKTNPRLITAAALAKLFPALVAGAPWGLAANGTPSPPPNQPLLASFWLLVQWESPALTQQLQRGERP